MSVEQWKRAIALTVLGIICLLLIIAVTFGVKYFGLREDWRRDSIIDLAEYNGVSEDESRRLYEYMNGVTSGETLDYQKAYPHLYIENDFSFAETDEKVCYLTFDDGPTEENTPKVLDTLKEHGIKATFFVIGREGEASNDLYRRIVDEGHTIAVHTYSHDYEEIYSSVESYLEDFSKISNYIEIITGVKPEIFRFPGGSVNGYNAGIYEEIIAEMLRRGYTYYDWNVTSRDTVTGVTPSDILRNVAYAADEEEDDIVVLMHDGENHENTAVALDEVITELERQGFTFAALDKNVSPICFGYMD